MTTRKTKRRSDRPSDVPPQPAAAKHHLAAPVLCSIGFAAVALACALCWGALQWEQLVNRATQAEARLLTAQKELIDRRERAEELREVEASLRQEMSQLNRLVDPQVEASGGIGVTRAAIAKAFDDSELVNKDEAAKRDSEHYAIENVAGSIQLWGPPDDLTQVEFFGALQGEHGGASNAVLVTLLSAAVPQWEAAQRNSWLAKLARVEDDVLVSKEIDRVRVNWHWTTFDGARLDMLSIEHK
jgi:hypothetical protein